jgi:hypothetical protein
MESATQGGIAGLNEKAPMNQTIHIQIWIESLDVAMSPGEMESAVRLAIFQSNRICRGIEIDKIEVEADMNVSRLEKVV